MLKKTLLSTAVILALVGCNKSSSTGDRDGDIDGEHLTGLRLALSTLDDNKMIVAHRGHHNNLPENSLLSIRSAIDENIDFVELDIRTTSDGKLVLLHDETLDRTTNCNGAISQTAWVVASQCLLNDRDNPEGEMVSLFSQALEEAKDQVFIDIDIKALDLAQLVDEVEAADMMEQVIFTVYDRQSALELQALSDEAIIFPLVRDEDDLQFYLDNISRPAVFQLNTALLDAIPSLDERNIRSFVNTLGVGDTQIASGQFHVVNRFLDKQASLLQTDYPVELKEYLTTQQAQDAIDGYYPLADFDAPIKASVGQVISFGDRSSVRTGEITQWLWDLGDGTTSAQNTPSHSYAKSGSYVVQLTVTSESGATDSSAHVIDIVEGQMDYQVSWSATQDGIMETHSATSDSAGNIIFPAKDANLYSLDAQGKTNWVFNDGTYSEYKSSPAYSQAADDVVISGYRSELMSIDAVTGQLSWKFDGSDCAHGDYSGPKYGSPAVDTEGNIYSGSYSPRFYSISVDGEMNWCFTGKNEMRGTPALSRDGSVVYALDRKGILTALDTATGVEKWSFDNSDSYTASQVVIGEDDQIYLAVKKSGGGDMNGFIGRLYAINGNGDVLWSQDQREDGTALGNVELGASALSGDNKTLYIAETFAKDIGSEQTNNAQRLLALNTATGDVEWSYTVGGITTGAPAVDNDGRIYLLSQSGRLYIFTPTGELYDVISDLGGLPGSINNMPSSLLMDESGNLYFGILTEDKGDWDGVTTWYGLRTDNGGVNNLSAWPQKGQNVFRTAQGE
ncbi:PQQ-binding-like beta-propeller repeat protein [Vibrio lamellibrachiae]|uniref:glycerophosphodiester phosphodiesterase family protein n=1 Tax=Vibrio lamellibrachiae TaxID=2910253 RepID=UPI003D0A7365